jgi:hypothetical protein
MAAFIDENTQFVDTNGVPLTNGSIYIGEQGLNPETNPITIYSDRELTVPLANPQTLNANGRSTNKIWIPGQYSFRVDNALAVQKLQDLDAGEETSAGSTSLTNVQGANTITADGVTLVAVLVDQEFYRLKAVQTNTGAVTLQIDSTPQLAVAKYDGSPLVANDIIANTNISVQYNETTDEFILSSTVPILSQGVPGEVLTSTGEDAVWAALVSSVVGDVTPSFQPTKSGWLKLDGQTIGSAASGADSAGAQFEDLYTLLWDNCADAECPVSTGRGASATADFGANKTLSIPDARGRNIIAPDNMGGTSAGVVTNSQADLIGGNEGSEDHLLTGAESGTSVHNHTASQTFPRGQVIGGAAGQDGEGFSHANSVITVNNAAAANAASAHNIMSPYLVMNIFVKY